ncbi:cytochrome C [Rhodoferax sp. GW822-FHT02A01]|uniref:cytochrome C n=1 Tax=Rhodoferax sp. GW822-FHT02A01 TaxID=3141537 RepID=UPI00315DF2FE
MKLVECVCGVARSLWLGTWRKSAIAGLVGLVSLIACQSALAVPTFARQTGQSCVACHAGGQYPELTPYGRMFKLTGYTLGEGGNPLSAMVVATNTTTQNPAADGYGAMASSRDGQTIIESASVFLAGKVTDNIGGFAQYTQSFPDGGSFAADNFDLRYADRTVDVNRDLVWGLTLNNNPSVQDVWNSAPAWSSPYMSTTQGAFGGLPYTTLLEGGLSQKVAGIGGYIYLDKTYYAELTSYQAAKGGLSFLSYPTQSGDTSHPFAGTYVDGNNLYWRLAYTREWDAHNIMVGAFGFDAKTLVDNADAIPDASLGSLHYRDVGIDAQYQYLLAPHTFTAQIRAIQENIDDNQVTPTYSGSATLNTLFAKASYVYRQTYGASLTYRNVTGSADAAVYTYNATSVPDSEVWTPEFFYLINQNVRVGVQFNIFTKYLGSTSNYDGAGRNASDNNSTYVYLWAAF